jgi:hypothetical protein
MNVVLVRVSCKRPSDGSNSAPSNLSGSLETARRVLIARNSHQSRLFLQNRQRLVKAETALSLRHDAARVGLYRSELA